MADIFDKIAVKQGDIFDQVAVEYKPPKLSDEAIDLAYEKYTETMRSIGEPGVTKVYNRAGFERSGQAKEWINRDLLRTQRTHFQKLAEATKRGQESFLTDQAYFESVMLGQGDSEALFKEWKRQQAKDQYDPVDGNWFEEMQYGSARILPGMIEGAKQSVPYMVGGATIGAATASAATLGVGAAPGAAAGLGVGFKVGATYAWYKQGAGEMLLTMRDKGFDPGASKVIASVAALPYALIEQIQVGQLTPGLRQGANKIIQKSVIRLMGQVAKKYGKTLTQEMLEEVAQEGVMIIAEDLASYFSDQGYPITEADLKQRAHRLWRTMIESGKSMALLPVPGAMVDMKTGKVIPATPEKVTPAKKEEKFNVVLQPFGKIETEVIETLPDKETAEAYADTKRTSLAKPKGTYSVEETGITEGIKPEKGAEIPRKALEEEIYKGKAYRVETRYIGKFKPEGTVADVLRYEIDILGNDYGITNEQLKELEKRPASDLVWVGRTKEDVVRYAQEYLQDIPTKEDYEKVSDITKDVSGGTIIGIDGEGGYLVLKPEAVIEPETPDQAIGKQFGLKPVETQERLDKAEVRYRDLKNKPVEQRSKAEKNELAFLKRNRKNIEAILERETQPLEEKMTKKKALALGHRIPELLGWNEKQRRSFNEKITGKLSMKDMVPAQRDQIVMALQREAKAAGIEVTGPDPTPVSELMAKLRERKQKPALMGRDDRNMRKLRKILHTMKAGTSFYFLHSSRLKRLCRALDNYEENGPFTKYIYQPVKRADTKATIEFTKVREGAIATFKELGIDAPIMMIEIKDIGIEDRLSTAERIGVYALAQNEKTMNHLLSEFSKEEIGKIVESVEGEENEMLVAAQVQGYFEATWPMFAAIAKANGIKTMIKEENYITAFVTNKNDLSTPDFTEGLMQQYTQGVAVPGEKHTIERKKGARRNLELNIFAIHTRAAKALERFQAMAPVASEVGSILNNQGFKQAINDVTYGHGSRVFDKWLQDAVRGQAAYDSSAMARGLRWLRMAGIHFVLGYKVLTAAKQGISFFPAMAVHPGMTPLVMANIERASAGLKYKQMRDYVLSKSDQVKTRDWNRDLRDVYNKKTIQKMYAGKKLSPLSMRMATNVDQFTVTVVWKSAYQLAQKHNINEQDSVQFADGVIEKTQPMGKAVDLPGFFRGNELEKNLTVFQNQINQNFNIFWYDILGETKAKKISVPMASYRLLMSYIIPAMLLGMIARGRPQNSPEEVAKDMFFYFMSPFVFFGRLTYNIVTGEYGPTRMIAEEPFVETGRLVSAIKKGDVRKAIRYSLRTGGAWSAGKIPLQAITTAEGAWDLATGESDDFRRLVWSEYAIRGKKTTARDKRREKFRY